jgi:hypothetical protein
MLAQMKWKKIHICLEILHFSVIHESKKKSWLVVWLMHEILATWEIEIGRIVVSSPRQAKSLQGLISTNKTGHSGINLSYQLPRKHK